MRRNWARKVLSRLEYLERKAETAMRIVSVIYDCDSRSNHRSEQINVQTGDKIISSGKRYSARTFEGLSAAVRRDFNRPNDLLVFVKRARELEEDMNIYEN